MGGGGGIGRGGLGGEQREPWRAMQATAGEPSSGSGAPDVGAGVIVHLGSQNVQMGVGHPHGISTCTVCFFKGEVHLLPLKGG